MATIGVVTFSATSPHKLNILQQAVNNNVTNKNNIINNNRDVIIVRKDTSPTQKQTVIPNSNASSVLIQNNLVNQKAVKKTKLKETGTGKVSNPTPIAVARRNARERNRVKQVNNGFATLRQHIPAAIAASFEQSGNSRGPNKKLSKVETLRMAVEYIRSLEDLLSSDDSDSTGNSSVSSGSSITSFPSPSPSSPMVSTNSVISQNYPFSIASTDDDDISINANGSPRPNIQQYIRIPGTDTFQLITTQISYEDEENIQPALSAEDLSGVDNDILIEPPLLESGMHFAESQDLSVFSQTNASLSSDIYSEHSLSPNSVIDHSSEIQYITQFTTLPPIEVLHPRSVIHNKISSTLISPVSNSPRLLSPTSDGIGSVITIIPQSPLSEDQIGSPLLNTEVDAIHTINEDHMINAMHWWNQEQRQSPKIEES